MYDTAEHIRKASVKDGWSSNVQLSELTMQDAEKIGCFSILRDMERGKKFFRMAVSGNIYNNRGEVVIFNIPTREVK